MAQAQGKKSQPQLSPFPPQVPKCRVTMQDLDLSPSPHPPGVMPAASTASDTGA